VEVGLGFLSKSRKLQVMKPSPEVIEIPAAVFDSADTLDELEDWLMARNERVMGELKQARRDDLAGKFKAFKPRHLVKNGKGK
jgi:hypothetical protein